MKLLFLSNVPAPYMVDFFNELGKLCNLTVVFEKRTSSERDKCWEKFQFVNFNGIVLNGISTAADAAFCPQIVKYLKSRSYNHIIVTNPTTPTGIIAIEYMKIKKIPFILESEGGFAKSGKGLKERFKKHLMSGAKLYFSTTPKADEYFLMYGAKKERMVRYPFTSLFEDDLLKEVISQQEKTKIKQALGITKEKMILSVGRFIHGKGYDILLHACKYIDDNVGVYIVGGIPTQEYLVLKDKLKLDNVHFMGFKSKAELKEYYKAADLFVLPTREDTWGLVINEAMACGLPVITTDMCIAGLELVKDHENGFIVPVGNTEKLTEKVEIILNNDKLRIKMSEISLEKISWYTIENMAREHLRIFNTIV